MERPSRREFLITAAATLAGIGSMAVQTGTQETRNQVREVAEGLEVTEQDLIRAIDEAKRSVFKVRGPHGHGSGFLLASGLVLTNRHVTAENEFRAEARPDPFALELPWLPPIPAVLNLAAVNEANYELTCFSDDDRRPGAAFRASPVLNRHGQRMIHKDMELLRLPPDAELPNMQPAPIGVPQLGRRVILMGSPQDLPSYVSLGIVTRTCLLDQQTGNPRWNGVPFVGTDAAINGGNSGGPMFSVRKERGRDGRTNLRTECIGISTYGTRGLQGLGGGIRADYAAYIATTRWGLPLMSPAQVQDYRRDFPTVQ